MAQAVLDPGIALLNPESDLFNLYNRFYQGMALANSVEAPSFPSADDVLVKDGEGHVVFDDYGNPIIDTAKTAEIDRQASEYSEIMQKNSAYMLANSILSVLNGGSSSSGGSGSGSTTGGFVSRSGDSMVGSLQALYGFNAGLNGKKIFEVTIGSDEKKWAIVSGNLRVTEDAYVNGALNLNTAIKINGNQVIYWDNGTLQISNPKIGIDGEVKITGTLTLGDALINNSGIYWDKHEVYHSGNSNKSDVDWDMCDATVYGDLLVSGDTELQGTLKALHGFSLGALGNLMLFSEVESIDDGEGNVLKTAWATLASDLKITNGHGIKFDNDYVINVRNSNVVSFSAPGMIMNLGDSDNGKATSKISLQSGVWDYTNTFELISKEGAGQFPNGLVAKCAVSGSSVLETFRTDDVNLGVLFKKQIRFGNTGGPAIYRNEATGTLDTLIPYINGQVDGHPIEDLTFSTYFAQTTSPFRNHSLAWSATLHFNTDGEFFCYDKPIEAEYFAIKSELYHTRLAENALFFGDGKFIEGYLDGLHYAGNGYFGNNISSLRFASGFAGYGWAVKTDVTLGGYHATFDSLTVRKKMRVYELEVQKISCTNGSLWVSDSCSGDEVIALN